MFGSTGLVDEQERYHIRAPGGALARVRYFRAMLKRAVPGMVPLRPVTDLSAVRSWRLALVTQIYFRVWSQLAATTVRRERDRLKEKAGKVSLSSMSKDELVMMAEKTLGIRREAAVVETAGQLRLMLKEAQDLLQRSEWDVPKGLTDMRKAMLEQQCDERGLDHVGMTREPMIRLIKQWSAASKHYGVSATVDMITDYYALETTKNKLYSMPQLAPAPVAKVSTSGTPLPVNAPDPRRICRPTATPRRSGYPESVSMATPRENIAPVGVTTSPTRSDGFVVVASDEPSLISQEQAAAEEHQQALIYEIARMLLQGATGERILLDLAAHPQGTPANIEYIMQEAKRLMEEQKRLACPS